MPHTHHLSIGSMAHWVESTTVLDLGPEHPSRTGLLLVDVTTEESTISAARIQPGFNHRSVEKLFEVRDHRQLPMLADRHDWQAPLVGELGLSLVCETMMGLVAPRRATWLRTLLAEHARIGSHLAHLSFVSHRTGNGELADAIRGAREQGRQLLLATTGNRVHPMVNRVGGLATDMAPEWIHAHVEWSAGCAALATEILDELRNSGLGTGIGILAGPTIDEFGLSGPVARAAGHDRDVRRRTGLLAYAQTLDLLEIPHAAQNLPTDGDAHSRFCALAGDIITSGAIIAACAKGLETIDGPVGTLLSKIIKIPDSECYLAIEAPWGMAGFHLVSRAERTPWRLKLRTPSFANVQALEVALVGCSLDQADIVVASLGWTSGDLDK